MTQKLRDIMTRNPRTLRHDATLRDAARLMAEENVGAIPVVDSNGVLLGIVTDRDLVVRGLAGGYQPDQASLSECLSDHLQTLTPDASVEDAVQAMRRHAIRRIPVTENQRLVGMVSLGDLAEERDRESVLGQISAAPPNA